MFAKMQVGVTYFRGEDESPFPQELKMKYIKNFIKWLTEKPTKEEYSGWEVTVVNSEIFFSCK